MLSIFILNTFYVPNSLHALFHLILTHNYPVVGYREAGLKLMTFNSKSQALFSKSLWSVLEPRHTQMKRDTECVNLEVLRRLARVSVVRFLEEEGLVLTIKGLARLGRGSKG